MSILVLASFTGLRASEASQGPQRLRQDGASAWSGWYGESYQNAHQRPMGRRTPRKGIPPTSIFSFNWRSILGFLGFLGFLVLVFVSLRLDFCLLVGLFLVSIFRWIDDVGIEIVGLFLGFECQNAAGRLLMIASGLGDSLAVYYWLLRTGDRGKTGDGITLVLMTHWLLFHWTSRWDISLLRTSSSSIRRTWTTV